METVATKDVERKAVPVTEQMTCRERNEDEMNLRKTISYTIIYQTISHEFKPLTASTTRGAAAWKILKEHFESMTKAHVIQLLDNFYSERYVQGENLGLFLL